LGDVNDDDAVNSTDALIILSGDVGMILAVLSYELWRCKTLMGMSIPPMP